MKNENKKQARDNDNSNEKLLLSDVSNCPYCGSSDLDKDEHFCNNCYEYYDD